MKSPWATGSRKENLVTGKQRQESLAVTFWLLFNENRNFGPNDFLFKMTAIHERKPVGIKILVHKISDAAMQDETNLPGHLATYVSMVGLKTFFQSNVTQFF